VLNPNPSEVIQCNETAVVSTDFNDVCKYPSRRLGLISVCIFISDKEFAIA
jgi:hypothetical protein